MKSICEQFQDVEAHFWNLELKGVKCWHIIRNSFYMEVYDEIEQMGKRHPDQMMKISFLNKIKLGIAFMVNSILNNPSLRLKKGKEYLILCTPRKQRYKGKYIYPIIEPALNILDGHYNYIERPNHFVHIKDNRKENVAYSDYIELKRAKNQYIKKYYMDDIDKKKVSKIIDILNERFDIALNKDRLYKITNERLTGFLTYYYEYGKILDELQPQYVLEVVHYENAELALTKAAHERNIQVIELQHGTMGQGHIAYNFKSADEYTPDKLLLFGEYWKESTNYPGKMLAVGYPYLEEQISDLPVKKKNKTILFISQGPIAKDLIKLALKLENYIIESKLQYKLIYKLHPNEYQTWKTRYPELLNSNIEVIDNNEKNLYDLFRMSSYQIGVSSTALLEGMAFGLKTIILKAPSYDYFEKLIEKEYMVLVEDLRDVVSIILNHSNSMISVEQLWKSNSFENLKKELTMF